MYYFSCFIDPLFNSLISQSAYKSIISSKNLLNRDWVKAGVFETIFSAVNEDVDLEYAMIDGTIVKVHRHGQGAKGGH